MKIFHSFLIILLVTMMISLSMFSTPYYEFVYSQKEENQTDFIDKQKEMNLTLDKPIYIERFTVPNSQNDNLTTSIYSFSGNGNLSGIKVSATGNGVMVPREDGTSSITDGRALFTSENGGNASYSFGAIINTEDNVTRHLGAAFFDANATGNLEFLKSVVGIYKALIGDEQGTFTMWQLK